MDNSKIVTLKKELLTKETTHTDLLSKFKSKKLMKTISLVAIPILFLLFIIFISIEERQGDSYYTTKPYEGAGLFTLMILLPAAIIIAIIGFVQQRKLKPAIKNSSDDIIKIKNELIELENSN